MAELVYGLNAVLEALQADVAAERLLMADTLKGPKREQIVALAKRLNVPVRLVSREKVERAARSDKTQGVLLYLKAFEYATLEDILSRSTARQEPPLLALLDGIADPHNLGAILRSADGAGLHGVILPKRRAVGVTATVLKTSAGAALHVPVARVSNLAYTIEALKQRDIWVVGADQNAEQPLFETDLTLPLGFIIGSEGKGLHRLVREKCDFLVRIPMFGQVNSLNAAVAAALLFFEARRQRGLWHARPA